MAKEKSDKGGKKKKPTPKAKQSEATEIPGTGLVHVPVGESFDHDFNSANRGS